MTKLPTFGTCDRCGIVGPLAATLDRGDRIAAVCSECESDIADDIADILAPAEWVVWSEMMAAL